MRTSMRSLFPLLFLLAIGMFSRAALGTENHSARHRAFRTALSPSIALSESLGESGALGYGLFAAYEFLLSPRFAIGLPLSYRISPGEPRLSQLSYGFLLKHYLREESGESASRILPYLEYGLMLQVSRLAGKSGSGTSHETRLAAGLEFPVAALGAERIYWDAGYHLSRLRYFDTPSLNLDRILFSLGIRWLLR